MPKTLMEELDLIAEEEFTNKPELVRTWIRDKVREYQEKGTLMRYKVKRTKREKRERAPLEALEPEEHALP